MAPQAQLVGANAHGQPDGLWHVQYRKADRPAGLGRGLGREAVQIQGAERAGGELAVRRMGQIWVNGLVMLGSLFFKGTATTAI